MLLSAIMTELGDDAAAEAALIALGDIVLLAAVDTARAEHDESVGEYVSGATRRFARLATDEDWLQLMTRLERADSPAGACLSTMVRWSLERDAREANGDSGPHQCSCGNGGGHGHDSA